MNIEQKQLELDKISASILAIHMIAQNIHYKAKGGSFWAIHKLMQLPIDIYPELVDKIYEGIFMPSSDLKVPEPKHRLKHAMEICESHNSDLHGLLLLIDHTLTLINKYKSENRAENVVIDEIAYTLLQIKGFIKATVDGGEQKYSLVGNTDFQAGNTGGMRINTTQISFKGKK